MTVDHASLGKLQRATQAEVMERATFLTAFDKEHRPDGSKAELNASVQRPDPHIGLLIEDQQYAWS